MLSSNYSEVEPWRVRDRFSRGSPFSDRGVVTVVPDERSLRPPAYRHSWRSAAARSSRQHAAHPEDRSTRPQQLIRIVSVTSRRLWGTTSSRSSEFVADEIRYEPYAGVLRGAAEALLVAPETQQTRRYCSAALLDASLVTYRFAAGKIGDMEVAAIIEGATTDVAGYRRHITSALAQIEPGAPPDSPPPTRVNVLGWSPRRAGPTPQPAGPLSDWTRPSACWRRRSAHPASHSTRHLFVGSRSGAPPALLAASRPGKRVARPRPNAHGPSGGRGSHGRRPDPRRSPRTSRIA